MINFNRTVLILIIVLALYVKKRATGTTFLLFNDYAYLKICGNDKMSYWKCAARDTFGCLATVMVKENMIKKMKEYHIHEPHRYKIDDDGFYDEIGSYIRKKP